MGLDIRWPIGLMFSLVGLLLVGYGLASDPAVYAKQSLGININLVWGIVQLAFGALMIILAQRAKKKTPQG